MTNLQDHLDGLDDVEAKKVGARFLWYVTHLGHEYDEFQEGLGKKTKGSIMVLKIDIRIARSTQIHQRRANGSRTRIHPNHWWSAKRKVF